MHYQRWRKHGDPLMVKPREWHVTEHGTTNEYQNFGCRCDLCKAAMSAYQREKFSTPCPGCGTSIYGRYRPNQLCQSCRARELTIPLDERHGTETGYSKGCRCDACRAAQTEKRKARRWKDPEATREYYRNYNRKRRARQREEAASE